MQGRTEDSCEERHDVTDDDERRAGDQLAQAGRAGQFERVGPFRTGLLGFAVAAMALAVTACGGGGEGGGRVIPILQGEDGCSPATVSLAAGEQVIFEVENRGSKDREIEGIEGTRLEEVLVPAGRTRHLSYKAPSEPGTRKLKCYVPGGDASVVVISVAGGRQGSPPATADGASPTQGVDLEAADQIVVIELTSDFRVVPSRQRVSGGVIGLRATNTSETDFHELAVLRMKEGGTYEKVGEIEDLAPGESGELLLALSPGHYLLACLIAAGEAGSAVDHFQRGMFAGFEVD